jgi:hypothetical protein
MVGSRQLVQSYPNAWRVAAGGLVVAAAIVGVAIAVGSPAARALNGVGALIWLGAGAVLALSLPATDRRAAGWVVAIGSAVLLAAVIRPGGVVQVVVWFAIAAVAVVVAAGDRTGAWALLAPAIYLPAHLLVGVGRAILRHGGVRTEPPPTAAIVPLAMVFAAAVAGIVAAELVRRSR